MPGHGAFFATGRSQTLDKVLSPLTCDSGTVPPGLSSEDLSASISRKKKGDGANGWLEANSRSCAQTHRHFEVIGPPEA